MVICFYILYNVVNRQLLSSITKLACMHDSANSIKLKSKFESKISH